MLQVKQRRAWLVAGWVTQALEQGRLGSCAHAGYHQYYSTLLYVHSSFASILMGKRELVALFSLSSWCLVIVVWLLPPSDYICDVLLARGAMCLSAVCDCVFPDHTHLLFWCELICH